LTDQKEPMLDFQTLETIKNQADNKKISYFKKVIDISEKELLQHQEFLKTNLKKNFF